MKGAISWGGGLDQLHGMHTSQADISLGHSFPRTGEHLSPLADNIEFTNSRLAALSDPHLDALQDIHTHTYAGSGSEGMHLSRNSSDEHLAAYARGSHHSLPTVAEDDIFNAIGGLELGLDSHHHFRDMYQHASALQDQHNMDTSRTLIVRNVSSDVPDEELRSIFQAFGDVRHLHTMLKSQGVVVVTYFDLRAATNAVSTLNGTLIQNIPISIACAGAREKDFGNVNQGTMMFHDSENTNEHLVWLFSKFGAVKGICESPTHPSQKFITFYDVRHAAAALRAMNRSAESLNKMPNQLTAQQVAALQPSISAPNLLQLGQLSSQLAAAEPQGNKGSSGLWGTSPSSSAMESLMQLAKQHADPHRMSQVHSHQNLASAAFAAKDVPPPVSHLANASSRQGSHHDLQSLQAELHQQQSSPHGSSPQQQHQSGSRTQSSLNASALNFTGYGSGMDALAASMGGMHVDDPSYSMVVPNSNGSGLGGAQAARRGSPMGGYPSRPGNAQGMMGGLMAGCGNGLPMYGGPLDSMGMLGGYDSGMGLDNSWMPPPGGMGYEPNGLGPMASMGSSMVMPYPPFHPSLPPPAYPPGRAGMPPLASPHPDLGSRQQQHMQLLQQAQLFAQLQAQQAMMMGQKGAGSPAAIQAAIAQFLQQTNMSSTGAANMGMLPPAAAGMTAALPNLSPGGYSEMGGVGAGGPRRGGMGGRGYGAAGGEGGGAGRSGGRLSRRTTDPQAELERKAQQEKLYALNPERIQRGEDKRTTLMIKNIPNKYTQKMLLGTMDEHFKGTYDFFYLPIDFKNKCNVGYAFINMVQPIDIIPLMQRFNNRKWERFNSEKVCSISYARIQGRAALVQHFQNSSLMHEDKRCRPILFNVEDNATVAGEQEAFPTPSNSGASSTGGATTTPPARSLSGSTNNSHSKLSSLPGAGSSSNLAALGGGSSNSVTTLSASGAGGISSGSLLGGSTSNLAALSAAAGNGSIGVLGGSTSNLAALAAGAAGGGSSTNLVVKKAANALAATATTPPKAQW